MSFLSISASKTLIQNRHNRMTVFEKWKSGFHNRMTVFEKWFS